jgi:hypothetical protein
MEYRLSITFADLGYSLDLPDRLLTILLEAMPQAGPVIDQDTGTGELTVTVAFESTDPAQLVRYVTGRLDGALVRAGWEGERTVLDVHVEAVPDDEGFPGSAPAALQLS